MGSCCTCTPRSRHRPRGASGGPSRDRPAGPRWRPGRPPCPRRPAGGSSAGRAPPPCGPASGGWPASGCAPRSCVCGRALCRRSRTSWPRARSWRRSRRAATSGPWRTSAGASRGPRSSAPPPPETPPCSPASCGRPGRARRRRGVPGVRPTGCDGACARPRCSWRDSPGAAADPWPADSRAWRACRRRPPPSACACPGCWGRCAPASCWWTSPIPWRWPCPGPLPAKRRSSAGWTCRGRATRARPCCARAWRHRLRSRPASEWAASERAACGRCATPRRRRCWIWNAATAASGPVPSAPLARLAPPPRTGGPRPSPNAMP